MYAQTVQQIQFRQLGAMHYLNAHAYAVIPDPTGPRAMLVRRAPTRYIQAPTSALSVQGRNTLRYSEKSQD